MSVLPHPVAKLIQSGRVRQHRPVSLAWLAGLVAVASIAFCSNATTATARSGPAPQWPAHARWQRYVVAPATGDVRPTRIVSFSGSVSGARALTGTRRDDAVRLRMTKGGPHPSVVVDYGEDVGGVPYFVVRSETGSPVLRFSYSEGLQYLGPDGDNGPSQSGAGDTTRSDSLKVAGSGTLTTGPIQGGERYERITLTSPGAVAISSVGIRFTAARATANDYRGWFDSSSTQLNRIWYAGAYTTQLDELPPGTLPGAWHVAFRSLDADGGIVGILRKGTSWTDYTASFDTKVVHNEAGWLVHAPTSSSGYLVTIDDATDATGTPDTLRIIALGPSTFSVLAEGRAAPETCRRWLAPRDGDGLRHPHHHVARWSSGSQIRHQHTAEGGTYVWRRDRRVCGVPRQRGRVP